MTVKIVTKKSKQALAPELTTDVHVGGELSGCADQIDRMGGLEQEIKPLLEKLKPLQDEYSKLGGEIQVYLDEAEITAEAVGQLFGLLYYAEYGKKADSTTVTDKEKVVELLENIEPGLFTKLADVGITKLRQYLTPDQLKECTETKTEGKRKIKIIKNASL